MLGVITVFIRLNAAPFIKFLAFPYAAFIQGREFISKSFFYITDISYCKSFVNIM